MTMNVPLIRVLYIVCTRLNELNSTLSEPLVRVHDMNVYVKLGTLVPACWYRILYNIICSV